VAASTLDPDGYVMGVAFSAPSSTDGRTVAYYTIEQSYLDGANWAVIGTSQVPAPTTAQFNVSTYAANTQFRFRVRAHATNLSLSNWSPYATATLTRESYAGSREITVTSALTPPAGAYTFASDGFTALALVRPNSAPTTRQIWAYDSFRGWHQPYVVPLPLNSTQYADPIGVACVGQYLFSYGQTQFSGSGAGTGVNYYDDVRYYRIGSSPSGPQMMYTARGREDRLYIPSNWARQSFGLQFGKESNNAGDVACRTSGNISGTPAVYIPYTSNLLPNMITCFNGITSGNSNGYVSIGGAGVQNINRYNLGDIGVTPSVTAVASVASWGIRPFAIASCGNITAVVTGLRDSGNPNAMGCVLSQDGGLNWFATHPRYGLGRTRDVETLEVASERFLVATEGPYGNSASPETGICWSESGYAWHFMAVKNSVVLGNRGHAVKVNTPGGAAILSMPTDPYNTKPTFYSVPVDPYTRVSRQSSISIGLVSTETSIGAINGNFYALTSAAATTSTTPSYRFRRTQGGATATVQDGLSNRLVAPCSQASTFTIEAYVGSDSATQLASVNNGANFSGVPGDRVVNHGDAVSIPAPAFVSRTFGGTPVMASASWRWAKLRGGTAIFPRGWQTVSTSSTLAFTADCTDAYSYYQATLVVPLSEGGTAAWTFPEFQVRVAPVATITQQPNDRSICTSCGTLDLGQPIPEAGTNIAFRVEYTACPAEVCILQWQYNTGSGWTDIPNDYQYLWQLNAGLPSYGTLLMRYLPQWKSYYDVAQFRCKLTFAVGSPQFTNAAQTVYLNAP
jgi:hypothetical protein